MAGSHKTNTISRGSSRGVAPFYEDHGHVYQADTCTQLTEAAKAGQVRVEALARQRYYGRRLPKNALIGLCSVGFWDAKHDEQWGLDWQRNEGIELTFLESGGITFNVDQQSFRLRPGDMTITRPWQLHRAGGPPFTAGRFHWLILDVGVRRSNQPWKWPGWLVMRDADRRTLTKMLRHNEQVVWHATSEIHQCFQRIAQAVQTDRSGSKISRLTVYINELFVLLLEMLHRSDLLLDTSLSSSRRMVELFLADVAKNLDSLAYPWTVRAMAKHCGLGVTHFTRLCREITNLGPAEYVRQHRTAAAAKLLAERPELNVTQVALTCGFSSGQYLASVFRQHFNRPPQSFRT